MSTNWHETVLNLEQHILGSVMFTKRQRLKTEIIRLQELLVASHRISYGYVLDGLAYSHSCSCGISLASWKEPIEKAKKEHKIHIDSLLNPKKP